MLATDDLTRLFRTLGDPTRLRLLRLVADCELSVMELAEVTQLAQSRISNHLKVLREEELVHERREGPWRHYRLDADRLPGHVRGLWASLVENWREDDQYLADKARLEGVLSRRHSRNGHLFERLADQWDTIRGEMFGDSVARALVRALLPRDTVVADIGTGTGNLIELLGEKPRRVIAIDNSEAMLAVAREKVRSLGLKNVEFRAGDAHDPPLKKGEVTMATFLMVLHYLADPPAAIKAAARALAPGGRLLIVDFGRHEETWLRDQMEHRWLGFAKTELEAIFSEAGLVMDTWSVLPGKPWNTPDGRRVMVPDGFAALATREARK
jgi:ubiquinone/menaquinone biosynthesis C-methylase UbiE